MVYSLSKLGIVDLNAMQQDMLEHVRKEASIVLLSATGSGKTLAYLLPLLELLNAETQEVKALVLVPSRELAQQTQSVLKQLSSEVRCVACYGGRPAMDEHRIIRELHPHVIIGTPGRILDHIDKRNFLTEYVETLVIDEFDKCLELGFRQQMSAILSELKNVRKRILLSATDSPSIPAFTGVETYRRLDYLDKSEQVPERIAVSIVHSPEKDKLQTLLNLVCVLGQQSSLVFVNYRESVERVGDYLKKNGVNVDVFHGGMEQRDRERALFRFCNGSCNVFVSTDLASRGLDIPQVDNIIHYHLPLNEESYIHRNGRTARWDAEGCAYLILGPTEQIPDYLADEPKTFAMPAQIPAPSQPKWVTLYIGKGKKDKVNKIDVVGFLSKVGGLSQSEIGRIEVHPNWSYASVESRLANKVLERVKGQKIKGLKTIISIAK